MDYVEIRIDDPQRFLPRMALTRMHRWHNTAVLSPSNQKGENNVGERKF
jgi:hypothetical protein